MKTKKKFLLIVIIILVVISISLIVLIKQLKTTDKFVPKNKEYNSEVTTVEKVNLENEVEKITYHVVMTRNEISTLKLEFITDENAGNMSFKFKSISFLKDIILNDEKIEYPSSDEVTIEKVLEPNKKYTLKLVANTLNEDFEIPYDTEIYEFKLPKNSMKSLTIKNDNANPWTEFRRYKYFIAEKYNKVGDKYFLSDFTNHKFTSSDVGKFICEDGSNSCSNSKYQIKSVEGNTIKEVNVYDTNGW